MILVQRYQGGRGLMLGAAIVGALGLAATFAGLAGGARATLFSYLFAFTYWAGIGLGALILLATFHASKARWPVVLRRPLEALSITCVPSVALFLPVALGMRQLFIWVDPQPSLGERALDDLHHKAPYLNVPFFLVRSALYLACWAVVAALLVRWSRAQDARGDISFTVKLRKLGGGILPLLVLTASFAAIDWLMSLEPLWSSTVYGLYVLSGAFLGALAALTLWAVIGRGPDLFGDLLTPAHYASLGKLLLAFTAFWAYIAFCQYMLIWIADLPHELDWYLVRSKPGWRGTAVVLVFVQFVIPFFALLWKRGKQRRGFLLVMAAWLLAAHVIDTYWLVMPALHPDRPWWRWTDLTAFLGVGGAFVASALFWLRGGYAIPVRDPYLRHSLRYHRL